jgi:hypothetical protein
MQARRGAARPSYPQTGGRDRLWPAVSRIEVDDALAIAENVDI